MAIQREVRELDLADVPCIMLFSRDSYLKPGEMYFFGEIFKKGDVTLEISIKKEAKSVIKEIHNFCSTNFYKVGSVNDGGKRFAR